ncbi:MAG: DUF4065 domain-containing protein [Sulfurimonas sp.]|uniref:Panacea domain-containing protein n=1 Tax=Sulfurimonas sp. TaxID=2022749 RepID=UPI0025FF4FEE|nr:type II toxin-antitoxin system antitoxin SocA domain-containing protein [Sulfurimonas sp.]MCK9490728.1 DUF4065 domain-containing protein [Sulfurimonas sp.]
MASVYDVAKYILEQQGVMTAMKLQKLVYYSQVWSLVWDEEELFNENIEAWANGPVAPELYAIHRGLYNLDGIKEGNISNITLNQKETIEIVLKTYGKKTSQWLSDRTHSESPWQEARKKANTEEGDRCNEVITTASMMEYYSSL